jgi:hypothetical protein
MRVTIRMWMQHRLNALHIQCRLCKVMPRSWAKVLSRKYEKVVHPILYG